MNCRIIQRTSWIIDDGFLPRRLVICELPENTLHPYVVWNQVGYDHSTADQLKYVNKRNNSEEFYFDHGDYCSTIEQAKEIFNIRVKRFNSVVYEYGEATSGD